MKNKKVTKLETFSKSIVVTRYLNLSLKQFNPWDAWTVLVITRIVVLLLIQLVYLLELSRLNLVIKDALWEQWEIQVVQQISFYEILSSKYPMKITDKNYCFLVLVRGCDTRYWFSPTEVIPSNGCITRVVSGVSELWCFCTTSDYCNAASQAALGGSTAVTSTGETTSKNTTKIVPLILIFLFFKSLQSFVMFKRCIVSINYIIDFWIFLHLSYWFFWNK